MMHVFDSIAFWLIASLVMAHAAKFVVLEIIAILKAINDTMNDLNQ
jgi:hypothetical protein